MTREEFVKTASYLELTKRSYKDLEHLKKIVSGDFRITEHNSENGQKPRTELIKNGQLIQRAILMAIDVCEREIDRKIESLELIGVEA